MIKKTLSTLLLGMSMFFTNAQDADSLLQMDQQIDSIEKSFKYEHGTIQLKNGIGSIKVPDGFKYLDAAQSERVLVDLWGNMPEKDISLGMILPENQGILSDSGYVFNIEYNEIGYVKDDDADDIDYKDLLQQMQKDAVEENKERTKEGYQSIQIVGWAAQPFYDKDKKVLHWAKEIKFGDNDVNTLNYNIRVLGRKGVLVLNAIATMPNLGAVKADVSKVLDIVQFNEGYAYKDFDPGVDEVAAWTIGGLVAGKMLAKAGLLAVLLKFWKLIAVGFVGIGGFLFKRFKKNKEEELVAETVPATAEIENSDQKA